MFRLPRYSAFLLSLYGLLIATADMVHACPRIGGLVDFNCDGVHKIVVTGDSVVRGVGDLRNNNNGGYVKRIARKLKKSQVINLGMPGFQSGQLLMTLKQKLRSHRTNKIQTQLADVDLLIIDIGRNDFFTGDPVSFTIRNLKRMVRFLRIQLGTGSKTPPDIMIATLIPTKRGFQRPFIEELNTMLLEMTSDDLPVNLRFDMLEPEIISVDGIHPDAEGYQAIAAVALDFVKITAQDLAAAKRPDNDNDGIYDMFERAKYTCDPELPDTDNDGLKDGEEAFDYETDPIQADSDGDTYSDGAEVTAGSNPLDPLSVPSM